MNEIGMLIEVCIQQHTCRLHRVKIVLIEARIKDTCRLHVKTELKQMNEVGKYNVESIISAIIASSILKNRLILVLRIFVVLGVAHLTLRLCFGGILASLFLGLFLSLFFAPDFISWTRSNLGWSQVLGLARSRNITGAWLRYLSECRCTAASSIVACRSSFSCSRKL